jgi:hypothetical protein
MLFLNSFKAFFYHLSPLGEGLLMISINELWKREKLNSFALHKTINLIVFPILITLKKGNFLKNYLIGACALPLELR